MAITPIGQFPARNDPAFRAYVDQFFTSILPTFSAELDAVATAFNNGSLTATSTSSHTINTTAGKVFAVASGLSFLKGMWVIAISTATADTNNYMVCMVQNYVGTSLTLDPKSVAGSGTIASWRIVIVPPATASVAKSEARLDTGAGYGTGSTFIRNFGTIGINTGSALTPALSASLGGTITVNVTGIYAITYQEVSNTVSLYVSRNQAVLTGAPALSERIISPGVGVLMGTRIMELTAGDVLRASSSAVTLAGTTGSYLSCVKLGLG